MNTDTNIKNLLDLNEKVKQLAEQVGIPCFAKMYVVTESAELEKLVRLVVQECVSVALD